MLLCLDIGNSHIFGGVFQNNRLLLQFRHPTYNHITSDQLGSFFKNVLRENNLDPNPVKNIALCSVVPSLDYSLKAACIKYFKVEPFVLNHAIKTGITIETKNPAEVGADIIAGVIAASSLHPNKSLIVIDLGTVTTIAAITENKECLGATFIPGINTAMNSLHSGAANLFSVEIINPNKALGRSTIESMQSGLFFGQLGAIKEIISRITDEVFYDQPLIIATGGFAHLFENHNLFDRLEPDLVLQGIKFAFENNSGTDEI